MRRADDNVGERLCSQKNGQNERMIRKTRAGMPFGRCSCFYAAGMLGWT